MYWTSPRARRPRGELETGKGMVRGVEEVDLLREREARCFSGEGESRGLAGSGCRTAARFCLISVDLRKLEKEPVHHCGSAVCEGRSDLCRVEMGSVVIITGVVSEG